MQATVHLQGIGRVPAVPVEMLAPGQRTAWNYSHGEYEVVVVARVSPKFVNLVEREIETGKVFTSRMKIGRLVGIAN